MNISVLAQLAALKGGFCPGLEGEMARVVRDRTAPL
jgi:hypothetical protein